MYTKLVFLCFNSWSFHKSGHKCFDTSGPFCKSGHKCNVNNSIICVILDEVSCNKIRHVTSEETETNLINQLII